MSEKGEESERAFQHLVRVLEEAVRAGADSVGLEREGGDLIVVQYSGNRGMEINIARDLIGYGDFTKMFQCLINRGIVSLYNFSALLSISFLNSFFYQRFERSARGRVNPGHELTI